MIYITGDKHGVYDSLFEFCYKYKTTRSDILIILGDAGINYYLDDRDYVLKNSLLQLPITLFCIHGNHEERPENIDNYKTKIFCNGIVYYEEEYSNILFARCGDIYKFNNQDVLVIGGAYSVDKNYRLINGYNWYESEQPSIDVKNRTWKHLEEYNNQVDIVLSHTCPYKYLPYEAFLSFIDQDSVDNTTELFLDEVEKNIDYKKWYCGHYHIEKKIDKMRFMMNDIEELSK